MDEVTKVDEQPSSDARLRARFPWRVRMADNWQRLHTRGTVIFGYTVAGVAPTAYALKETWNQMPDDLKGYLPHSLQQAISYSLLALTFIALRYTSVRNINKENK